MSKFSYSFLHGNKLNKSLSFVIISVLLLSTCAFLWIPQAKATTSILGYNSIGTKSAGDGNDNSKYGCRFQASATGTVTDEYVYSTTDDATNYVGEIGIYADNAGAPGALLGAGSLTITGNTPGWYGCTGLSVSVTAGSYYWLAFDWGSGWSQSYYYSIAGSANQFANMVVDAPPLNNPYGAVGSYSALKMSIYADVTNSGGGDTTPPTFGAISATNTIAGSSATISCTVSDDVAVSFNRIATNNTGSWVNQTAQAGGSASLTLTWNASGGVIAVQVWGNDTSGNQAYSTVTYFTLTTASTFGKTSAGGSSVSNDHNNYGCKFTLSEGADLSSIKLYAAYVSGANTASLGVYTYNTTLDAPQTLLASGSTTLGAANWYSATVSVHLTAGTYYLGFSHLDWGLFNYYYDAGSAGQTKVSWSGGLNNPFGSIDENRSQAVSIYATYTPNSTAPWSSHGYTYDVISSSPNYQMLNGATGAVIYQSANPTQVLNSAMGNCTSGQSVYVNPATYIISETVYNQNHDGVKLTFAPNAILYLANGVNICVFQLNSCNFWNISGININGNKANNPLDQHSGAGTHGIFLVDCHSTTIDQANITNVRTFGLVPLACTWLRITNGMVVHSGWNDIQLGSGTSNHDTYDLVENMTLGYSGDVGISLFAQSCIVRNVTVLPMNGTQGDGSTQWGAATEDGTGNNTFTQMHLYGGMYGVVLGAGDGNTLSNCTIQQFSWTQVFASTNNNIIANNTILNNATGVWGHQMDIRGVNNLVANNTVNSSFNGGEALSLQGSNHFVTGNSFTANTIQDNQGATPTNITYRANVGLVGYQTLNVTNNNGGTISESCNNGQSIPAIFGNNWQFPTGSTVTATASPFTSWTLNGSPSSSNPLSITMNGAVSLVLTNATPSNPNNTGLYIGVGALVIGGVSAVGALIYRRIKGMGNRMYEFNYTLLLKMAKFLKKNRML
jgi:hypothetical protein